MDRNLVSSIDWVTGWGRLPRGGRGSQRLRTLTRCVGSARRLPRGGRGSQHADAFRCWFDQVASREGGVDRNGNAGMPSSALVGRLPRGGRGSQHLQPGAIVIQAESPPARGAWIATACRATLRDSGCVASREGGVDRNYGGPDVLSARRSRLPRGGRGSQRAVGLAHRLDRERRLPRGGRGSQLFGDGNYQIVPRSPPARGAWIATASMAGPWTREAVASREGGVDRNTTRHRRRHPDAVASREGGVDRNRLQSEAPHRRGPVASREGGVDRNNATQLIEKIIRVASREGGVDRNTLPGGFTCQVASRLPRGGRGSQHR